MSTQIYSNPHKNLDEQVKLLEQRGLKIENTDKARHYLATIGYYRLSSYCFVFETSNSYGCRTHTFKNGITFEQVISLYVFDQKLRLLLLEALERFEVTTRASWAYYLSEEAGSHPHLKSDNFKNFTEYQKSLELLEREIQKAKSASFVEINHYFRNYISPESPPIWLAVSCLTFGSLFRWVKNTKSTKVKHQVAKTFCLPNIALYEGVARSLTTIRNICAHHGRVWDIRMKTKVPLIGSKHLRVPLLSTISKSQNGLEADNRLFNIIAILVHITLAINPDSSWPARVQELILCELDPSLWHCLGVPENWKGFGLLSDDLL